MKSYTNLEQSRKLAEILTIDSADMWWPYYYDVLSDTGEYDKEPMLHKPICDTEHTIPCWSLAALLNYLKSKNKFPEIKELSDGRFKLTTFIWDGKNSIQFSIADNLVNACYEMILKLHEQKLL